MNKMRVFDYIDSIRDVYPSMQIRMNSTRVQGIAENYKGNTEFSMDNEGHYDYRLNYGEIDQKIAIKGLLEEWSMDLKVVNKVNRRMKC